MALTPAQIDAALATWPVARLAWIAPDGAPRQVPIVFARLGDALWSPIDGKRKSGRPLARMTHLRHSDAGDASDAGAARVCVLLDEYTDDWSRLWWLRVDGEARVIEGRTAEEGDGAAAAAALRAKHPQYATTPLFAGAPAWLRIRVVGVRSWRARG